MRWPLVLPTLMCACTLVSGGGKDSPLHGYRLLVESHDSLSNALAAALKQKGFSVRRKVSGGSPPTAAVVTFTFRDSTSTWLAAWLADTRSGAIVAGVSLAVDSLETAALQAHAVADSVATLLAHPATAP